MSWAIDIIDTKTQMTQLRQWQNDTIAQKKLLMQFHKWYNDTNSTMIQIIQWLKQYHYTTMKWSTCSLYIKHSMLSIFKKFVLLKFFHKIVLLFPCLLLLLGIRHALLLCEALSNTSLSRFKFEEYCFVNMWPVKSCQMSIKVA